VGEFEVYKLTQKSGMYSVSAINKHHQQGRSDDFKENFSSFVFPIYKYLCDIGSYSTQLGIRRFILPTEVGFDIENIPWMFSGLGIVVISTLFNVIKYLSGFITNKNCIGIAGNYNVFTSNSPHEGPHGNAVLKQFFGWVWGSITINVTESGNHSKTYKYKYSGSYSKEQAILKFTELGKNKRIIGGTVLKVLGRADELEGCNTFWEHTSKTGGIRTQGFKLTRKNA
jgi:hypothetical protein